MITLDGVERIHEILIDKFGGKKGLRDYWNHQLKDLFRTIIFGDL